jgi:hypothetical protein
MKSFGGGIEHGSVQGDKGMSSSHDITLESLHDRAVALLEQLEQLDDQWPLTENLQTENRAPPSQQY